MSVNVIIREYTPADEAALIGLFLELQAIEATAQRSPHEWV